MEVREIESTIEAILFASGEPVAVDRIADILDTDRKTLNECADSLSARLDSAGSGLQLLRLEDKLQLTTRKESGDYVKKALDMRRNTPLSQASLEVLAIVAYNQPVTKAFIEQVRGVDCSYIVTSLCQKGLIDEKGRLDLPGRPLVYGTTTDFLRVFGIESLADLPPLPETPASEDSAEDLEVMKEFAEQSEEA